MATYTINPSTEQVGLLSGEFLKKYHKIMKGKGFKLTSETTGSSIIWKYTLPSGILVYVRGWHGRDSKRSGCTKMIHSITINLEGKESWNHKPNFEIIDILPMRIYDNRNNLPKDVIETYLNKLEESLVYLENIENHISLVK